LAIHLLTLEYKILQENLDEPFYDYPAFNPTNLKAFDTLFSLTLSVSVFIWQPNHFHAYSVALPVHFLAFIKQTLTIVVLIINLLFKPYESN